MKPFIYVMILLSFKAFAIDENCFIVMDVSLSEYDLYKMKQSDCSSQFQVFESQGVFLSHLKNGAEYGFLVSQIKVIDIVSNRVISIHSNDVVFENENSVLNMRGNEVNFSNLKCGNSNVQVTVEYKSNVLGVLNINPLNKKLKFSEN